MGADLYSSSAAAKRVFDACDEALGFSLSSLCFHGPEETLRQTINAQPAIVSVSLAFLAAFQDALSPGSSTWSSPLKPAFTAGHSVGEWSALVASGSLDLSQAIRLVRERGRLMDHEEHLCPGGMAAIIGSDGPTLQKICQEVSAELSSLRQPLSHPGLGQVVVANYNAPGQIVLSGENGALQQACTLAVQQGAKKIIPLSVSGAFHSPGMLPAAAHMADVLQSVDIQSTSIPVISNITALPLSLPDPLRSELSQQLAASVQWVSSIDFLISAGVTTFIEIGPGKALSGMVKRIAKDVSIFNISCISDLEKTVTLVREMGVLEHV